MRQALYLARPRLLYRDGIEGHIQLRKMAIYQHGSHMVKYYDRAILKCALGFTTDFQEVAK